MERKFNKFGKPLPNKDELKLLSITDKVIRKRLGEYLVEQFNDWVGSDDTEWPDFESQLDSGVFDTTDTEELADLIINGENIKDNRGTPVYYRCLKTIMNWFFKDIKYEESKNYYERGNWNKGWVPDIANTLGTDFEESYALVLLWLNNQLKKYGTSVPEIESSINENSVKNLIKKIIKEQIVNNEHSICGILTCNKLDEVINKINYNRLIPIQKEKLNKIISNYNRDVSNNLKNAPTNGGLKNATGDSELDICDMYLHEIQSLICQPTQK